MTVVPKTFGQPRTSPEVLLETLFRPMGVDGVYGRTGRYEGVVEALAALISRHREPGAEILRLPPVVSRALIEKSGYLKSFPHLLGCVCALGGGEREIGAAVDRFIAGEDWTEALASSELVLAPAACYPVYPMAAAAGPIPADGLIFDVACDCFRREPSRDIDRFQSFRMREYVFIGDARADAGVPRALVRPRDRHRRLAGPQLSRGDGERSVLRARRRAGRQGAGAAIAEVRTGRALCARPSSRPPA